MLKIFERKILRKIYGTNDDNGIWYIRYGQELKYKETEIKKVIKLEM